MECWKIVSASKMHGSARGIKAFHGKLWGIEAVDSEFTFQFAKILAFRHSRHLTIFRFSLGFKTYGGSFPAILG
jgi:hypothetical protein